MQKQIKLYNIYVPKSPLILESYIPNMNMEEKDVPTKQLIESSNKMFQGFGIVRGDFQEADVRNENNRIYRSELVEKITREFSETSVRNRNALGELDHPKDDTFSPELSKSALAISEIYYNSQNKLVSGEYTILPTTAGRNLLALHIARVNVGVSARGIGSLVPDYSGIYENTNGIVEIVQDDYMLSTYDVVSRPSFNVAGNMDIRLHESLDIYEMINKGHTNDAYKINKEIAESWERYWDNLQSMLDFIKKNGIN